jgi:hypothetical protein
MIEELPEARAPDWLTEVSSESMPHVSLPLRGILEDSLYYPSSHFDGDPVRCLAGNIYSFVYVDYGQSQSNLLAALRRPGFRGYRLLGSRSVTEDELTPRGWSSTPPLPSDGDPNQHREWIKQPFCIWSVFERVQFDRTHGPDRFSMLFLCADGAAAFQALYIGNAIAPKVIAIIQPGHAFGGNWTDFTDPKAILARSVLQNPYGKPDFLLYGGYGRRAYYREPCWPDFGFPVRYLSKGNSGVIGVWSRARLSV